MTDEKLLELALDARKNAYVPYSGYAVGAALLTEDGRVFTGCNVENAAYGNTLCAERTALVKAVSEGCRRFTKIAIASAGSAPYPCGACRQSLYEFAPELEVLVTWDGNVARAPLGALLPRRLWENKPLQSRLCRASSLKEGALILSHSMDGARPPSLRSISCCL